MELYAPQSDVKLTGGSNLYGSVVANTLTISASSVHYDASATSGGGGVTMVQ